MIRSVLSTDVFEIENREAAWRAYYDYDEGGADFSDYYIAEINRERGASHTVSFDADALKSRLFKAP